jgi:hypothetical protein
MTHLASLSKDHQPWPAPQSIGTSAVPAVPSTAGPGAGATTMADVQGLIGRVLIRAKAMGRDDLTQTRAAAHAVIAVRPDLTLAQAFNAVTRMRALGTV